MCVKKMIHYSMITGLLLGLLFALGADASIGHPQESERSEYNYRILREGAPIGEHRVVMQRDDEGLEVRADTVMDIRFLGFSVYRFRYQAEEVWDRSGLKRLFIKLDDDGEKRRIDGERRGSDFHWRVDGGAASSVAMPVYPTNHWNAEVLRQNRVLNTLTGKINSIAVAPLEQADTPAGLAEPSAFQYQGELQLESWYDENGRWLGMRFRGSDGSTIEYLCSDCPAGTGA